MQTALDLIWRDFRRYKSEVNLESRLDKDMFLSLLEHMNEQKSETHFGFIQRVSAHDSGLTVHYWTEEGVELYHHLAKNGGCFGTQLEKSSENLIAMRIDLAKSAKKKKDKKSYKQHTKIALHAMGLLSSCTSLAQAAGGIRGRVLPFALSNKRRRLR
ncbi:hypothetical protein BaRGS_00027412 [Batillaria attramentaria]|uniref:Uncharacterized protein n=1 Tax=Batillaria attramentaria TaxID=370345 RepID=A0ABD0K2M4_9CAEN